MPRFELLHEASGLEDQLAEKYGVASYGEYLAWTRTTGRQSYEVGNPRTMPRDYSPLQEIAFSLVTFIGTVKQEPRYIVLGVNLIRKFVKNGEEIPQEFNAGFAQIPLTYDLEMPMRIAVLL